MRHPYPIFIPKYINLKPCILRAREILKLGIEKKFKNIFLIFFFYSNAIDFSTVYQYWIRFLLKAGSEFCFLPRRSDSEPGKMHPNDPKP